MDLQDDLNGLSDAISATLIFAPTEIAMWNLEIFFPVVTAQIATDVEEWS